jgi:O-antigen/teichoic acid export membrane protein
VRQDLLGSLFLRDGFSPENFPDLAWPVAVASFVLLVAAVVLYNVQTRRLNRHPPLLAMQEWLFWTALAVFGLLVVYFIFRFYFVFVVVTLVVGLATFVWIRFVRFPPLIDAYNAQLRRARFMSQAKYRAPEATIRPRKSRSRRRR